MHASSVIGGRATTPGPIACSACDLNEVCRLSGLIALEGGRIRQATGTLRVVRQGTHLYRTGAPANALYAVRQGLLKLVHVTADGDERTLRLATPGEVLGLEAFSLGAYATDAIALQSVVCCELPFSMLEHGTRVRELATALLRLMSRATAPKPEQARGSIRARVVQFLLDLSARLERHGLDGRQFVIGLSRRELADLLDMRIETVSRMMQRLHREHAIDVRDNSVTLLGLAAATEEATRLGNNTID
jgi:CRP/FNR family transcriptional regulator, anaerobic regulatory protein